MEQQPVSTGLQVTAYVIHLILGGFALGAAILLVEGALLGNLLSRGGSGAFFSALGIVLCGLWIFAVVIAIVRRDPLLGALSGGTATFAFVALVLPLPASLMYGAIACFVAFRWLYKNRNEPAEHVTWA